MHRAGRGYHQLALAPLPFMIGCDSNSTENSLCWQSIRDRDPMCCPFQRRPRAAVLIAAIVRTKWRMQLDEQSGRTVGDGRGIRREQTQKTTNELRDGRRGECVGAERLVLRFPVPSQRDGGMPTHTDQRERTASREEEQGPGFGEAGRRETKKGEPHRKNKKKQRRRAQEH